MSILDPARRAYVHFLVTSVVGALAVWGVLGDTLVPLIPGAVLAAFDLAVAFRFRTTTDGKGKLSAAVYALALACQPVGLALAFGTDAQWGAALTVLSAVLGGSLAAGRAPSPA